MTTFKFFIQEWKIVLRDRQALSLLFVMPLLLILFITLALKDLYLQKVGKSIDVQLVVPINDELSSSFEKELLRYDYKITKTKVLDRSLKSNLAILLPAELDDTVMRVKNGEQLPPDKQLQILFDPVLDQSLRSLVSSHLSLALQSVLIKQIDLELEAMNQRSLEKDPEFKMPFDKIPNMAQFDGLVRQSAFDNQVLPNPIQQTVPAWTLFGMFFIVIPISNSLIRDRQYGIFKRLLSFPISKWQVLLGKTAPFVMINFFQFLLMFTVGFLVLPQLMGIQVNMGFRWDHLFLVTVACSLAATSFGLLVATFSKTNEQASAFGALSVVLLAVVGGVMIPRLLMPEFMRFIAQASPMYWGLEAYFDVLLRGTAGNSLFSKLLGLVGFAGLCYGVSLKRFRWGDLT
jgi:ABC-2 type transport system permease protein